MTAEEIKETEIWRLYETCRSFHRRLNTYAETDMNHRFFNGDQWNGAKLAGIEPVKLNFIKPVVKYKLAVIHSNLYEPIVSSQNFSSREFSQKAEAYCTMLNRFIRRAWNKDEMDFKLREVVKDAAINSEGILYTYFDEDEGRPVHQVVDKVDIYYGDENNEDIQTQPFILLRKRMPVRTARELAEVNGVSEEDILTIIGDSDTIDESGDAAKEELFDGVTVVYKFYKSKNTVFFEAATKHCDIIKETDTGISSYPFNHYVWERTKGSARGGESEVRALIPNQIEVNKIAMRRLLTAKKQAHPYKVVDKSKIANPEALDSVGATIFTKGQGVDDVKKAISTIPPAQMSPDIKELWNDLISLSRELAGAGDAATGQINPNSDVSGKAVLAIQQASEAPMTENKEFFKRFIGKVAKLDIEFIIAYSRDGIDLEEERTDEFGNEYIELVHLPHSVLRSLKAEVKIDVTPRSPFDRFAQERTLENYLGMGLFRPDRLGELRAYIQSLDDDSVSPKRKLEEIADYIEQEQQKIALIQQQQQLMRQNLSQFLMGDEELQSDIVAGAMNQLEREEADNGA